jgi:hypothetical protein
MYSRASGGVIKLTPFTDAIFGQTDPVPAGQELPGHIVLWEFGDPTQQGTRFPHVGLWLTDTTVLDCREPDGVGEHPTIRRTRHVRQVRATGR